MVVAVETETDLYGRHRAASQGRCSQPVPSLRIRSCTWQGCSSRLHFCLALPAPVAELFTLGGESVGILLLVIVPLALWIYAELKLGRIPRIVAGLMLVGAAVAITNFFVTYIPRHEALLHRGSMLVMNELILTGNVQRGTDALGVYNKI